MDTRFHTVEILGYDVFSGTIDQCADAIVEAGSGGARECRMMSCLNPHSYVIARQDALFREALSDSEWLLPDGSGVVLAARWLGLPLASRVTGPDTFLAVMKRLDARGGSVYFLGSTEKVLDLIRRRVALEFPNIIVAGTYSPPYKPVFSDDDNKAMCKAINAARPDLLWVGMTAPKQEKWLAEHRAELEVGAAGAVGAAFDFFAGTVKRSPKVFQSLHLEWLPRLIQQPRRLWKRMVVSAPVFLLDVLRAKLSRKHRSDTADGGRN